MELTPGQEYKRTELHDHFGGSRQSGISTPADNDLIFIFTGETGEQYGYEDGWQGDGYFHYTGEGQVATWNLFAEIERFSIMLKMANDLC